MTESAVWADGRYFVQAEKEIAGTEIQRADGRAGRADRPSASAGSPCPAICTSSHRRFVDWGRVAIGSMFSLATNLTGDEDVLGIS